MSAMSNYLEGKLIDHLLRSTPFPKPATLYFALFTSDPTDAGTGQEVTGGGYARVPVVAADANFSAPTAGDGTSKNQASIIFPFPTAAWGTVTHWAMFDAQTSGNMLIYGVLKDSLVIPADSPPVVFMREALTVVLA